MKLQSAVFATGFKIGRTREASVNKGHGIDNDDEDGDEDSPQNVTQHGTDSHQRCGGSINLVNHMCGVKHDKAAPPNKRKGTRNLGNFGSSVIVAVIGVENVESGTQTDSNRLRTMKKHMITVHGTMQTANGKRIGIGRKAAVGSNDNFRPATSRSDNGVHITEGRCCGIQLVQKFLGSELMS